MTDYHLNLDLIAPLHAARKRMVTAGEEAIEATLAYAQLLLTAREAQPSDQAFGQWLVVNELDDLSKDDRAALLQIARHPDLYRECVAESGRRSVQLLWREEMEPRVRNVTKLHAPSADAPESDPATAKTPDSAGSDSAKSDETITTISARQRQLTPFKRLPHYELVLTHVLHPQTRTVLASHTKKKGGQAIWALLVTTIQQGTFGPPSRAAVSRANLRLIFPWSPKDYAQRFDLTDGEQRAGVRDQICPVVLAQWELLQREPEQLPQVIGAANALSRQAVVAARQVEQATKRQAAVAALPITEHEIVMYGTPFWPPQQGTPPWSYRELQEACWAYRLMAPMLESVNIERKAAHRAQEVRQNINLFLKWDPCRGTAWAEAVRAIGLAYEANPEGECRVAPAPPNFGLS